MARKEFKFDYTSQNCFDSVCRHVEVNLRDPIIRWQRTKMKWKSRAVFFAPLNYPVTVNKLFLTQILISCSVMSLSERYYTYSPLCDVNLLSLVVHWQFLNNERPVVVVSIVFTYSTWFWRYKRHTHIWETVQVASLCIDRESKPAGLCWPLYQPQDWAANHTAFYAHPMTAFYKGSAYF